MDNQELELYYEYKKDPIRWVEDVFGMPIQKVLPEYEELLIECRILGEYSQMKLSMFEPFKAYSMRTRQQGEILHSVKNAINGRGKRKISIKSGHGIGKSSVISIIVIWFLFSHYRSVVACTAPSADLMGDVLWKELYIWIQKLPPEIRKNYNWSQKYIRMGNPSDIKRTADEDFDEEKNTRFARARTASKDRPEALSGLHADDMLLVVDEASGVFQGVFDNSKGALSNDNNLFIMISNPTRNDGYFYNSHNKNKQTFKCMTFNSEQSPIVGEGIKEDIIAEHGKDSDEYKIRVLGEFPEHGEIDSDGYMDLFDMNKISFITEQDALAFEYDRMGLDPSGMGIDATTRCVRNDFVAKIAHEESTSTEKSIANTTITLLYKHDKITGQNVAYDNFGVGANVGVELASNGVSCIGVNGADPADNKNMFMNKRAEMFWRIAQWLKQGGQLVGDAKFREDLSYIKYKRNTSGKIQIMPKIEIKKRYGKSPDRADALGNTFFREYLHKEDEEKKNRKEIYNPLTGSLIKEDNEFLETKNNSAW